jgi:hypothetical protein
VVALDGGGAAGAPLAGQVKVVGALAPDMALADVVLERSVLVGEYVDGGVYTYIKCFRSIASLAASLPLACQVVDGAAVPAH